MKDSYQNNWPGTLYIGGSGSDNVHSDPVYNAPSDVEGFYNTNIIAESNHSDFSLNPDFEYSGDSLRYIPDHMGVLFFKSGTTEDEALKSIYDLIYGTKDSDLSSVNPPNMSFMNYFKKALDVNSIPNYSNITWTKVYRTKSGNDYGYVPSQNGWVNLRNSAIPSYPWHLNKKTARYTNQSKRVVGTQTVKPDLSDKVAPKGYHFG